VVKKVMSFYNFFNYTINGGDDIQTKNEWSASLLLLLLLLL